MINLLKAVLSFLKQREFLTGFVATMLGVLVAFALNDWWHTCQADKATKYRLHQVVLESQYNSTIAYNALKPFTDADSFHVSIEHVDPAEARLLLRDDNALRFISPSQVSLIRSYVKSLDVLNSSLDVHMEYFCSPRFKRGSEHNEILETVRNNCAAAIAICIVLRENLDQHFEPGSYEHDKMREQEQRLKAISQKVLRGEIVPSKE